MKYGLQVCICEDALNEGLLCTVPDFAIRTHLFFDLLVFIDPLPDRK